MKSDLYILLHILLSYISSGTAVCYDPSGDSVSDPSFQPCGNSMCCATNRTNPPGGNYDHGFTADQCLENGLCENKIQVNYEDGDTGLVTLYYREYCTSSNWTNNAGGRLDVCTEQTVCVQELESKETQRLTSLYAAIRILVLASLIIRLS